MKKLLVFLFFMMIPALCFAGPVQRAHMAVIAGSTVASGGCSDITQDECDVETQGDYDLGRWHNMWRGVQFTASDTYTACSATALLAKVGTGGSGTLTVCIYSNNSTPTPDEPDELIGTCSDGVAASGITPGDVSFSGISASLEDGVLYWFVLKIDNTDYDNYIEWEYSSACNSLPEVITESDDSGSTYNSATGNSFIFDLNK